LIKMDEMSFLVEIIRKTYGEDAASIFSLLLEKGEVRDEELARILNLPSNEIRKILHVLFDADLVRYRRIKDPRLKWYTYYWRIIDVPPRIILQQKFRKILQIMLQRLSFEKKTSFYICPLCKKRYTFEEASINMFKCPNDEKILEIYENKCLIDLLQKIINLINIFLAESFQ